MTIVVSTASWFSLVAASTFPNGPFLAWSHRGVCPHLTQEHLVSWNLGLPRARMVKTLMLGHSFPSVLCFTHAILAKLFHLSLGVFHQDVLVNMFVGNDCPQDD